MLRCAELNLSDDALRGMTIGMVNDLYIEKENDKHKYPYIAEQSDIKKFFG